MSESGKDLSFVELGYILLEYASVRLAETCATEDSSGVFYSPNVWYDILLSSIELADPLLPHSFCRNYEFVLDSGKQNNALHLPWGPRKSSAKAKKEQKTCSCQKAKMDALVIFGILNSLQSNVAIVQCKALFHDRSFQTATIFVTLRFPNICERLKGGRALLRSRSSIALSNEWQLLLSLIRSDWEELECIIFSLQNPEITRANELARQKTTLFPTELSMEELYRRIQGSPFDEEHRRRTLDRQLLVQDSWLAKLPRDILKRHLATFLAAKELDSIRCSCSYFHGLMESIVPGLKLQLYRHQIESLNWMRNRECKELWESDCLDVNFHESSTLTLVDGDLHRAVTGGHTVLLTPRGAKRADASFRVDTLTGQEYRAMAANSQHMAPRRRVCRGGLLVDEPGLGKTITVISLILQTAGLTTESVKQSIAGERKEPDDELLFRTYWNESVPPDFRRQDLLRLMNSLAKRMPAGAFYVKALGRKVNADAFATNFDGFQKDIESLLQEYHTKCGVEGRFESFDVLLWFRKSIQDYKARMLASAKKSFANPLAKPNSALAFMIEESKRRNFIKALVPSKGTLIVIPKVLLDHWEAQIDLHVNMRYLSKKLPLIFTYGNGGISPEAATELIDRGSHEAIVFIDRGGTKTLPPADFLAKFLIVITTSSRLSQEWENGSFHEECAFAAMERLFEHTIDRSESQVCSLLKIHWLRLIIDEGHSMGRSSIGSGIEFASWISSECRWVMTGTPTKEGRLALTQFRNLVRFLQHDFFTRRGEGDSVWKNYIDRPWRAGNAVNKDRNTEPILGGYAAFFRLRALMKLLMKRHTKADILELSPPQYQESLVPMSFAEVTTYNTLISAIQSNLLLTSMKEDAQQDSLLHRSQTRFAREALANVRRVCVGFSRVVPTLSTNHWAETVELMNKYCLSPERQDRIRQFMSHATNEGLTSCDCCGLELSILLVLPCCGGLVCTECMDGQKSTQYTNDGSEKWHHEPRCNCGALVESGESKAMQALSQENKAILHKATCKKRKDRKYYFKECLFCENPFDVDNLQLLQPGFFFNWRDNLEQSKANIITDGEVPMRVNDGAGVNENGGVDRGRFGEINPGHGEQLIVRPPVPRKRTKKCGDGHSCTYDRYSTDGKCILCHEEHTDCNLLLSRRCDVCYRTAEDCPEEETKSFYLVNKCLSLMQSRQPGGCDTSESNGRRPIKIIVFSQFRKALNLVGDRLLRRFGTKCVSEYWGTFRTVELLKFTQDPECFCMLLGRDGSEGLDLSFVTHIFFLEEIWDKSLADQTVSRAWRMGARGAVQVETILAKDSVEMNIKAYEAGQLQDRDLGDATPSSDGQKDQQQRKTHVLLKSLRFLTDYHQFSKQPRNSTKQRLIALGRKENTSTTKPPPAKRQKVTFAENLA